jgi:D-alanyl-D-alanine dipeptidase
MILLRCHDCKSDVGTSSGDLDRRILCPGCNRRHAEWWYIRVDTRTWPTLAGKEPTVTKLEKLVARRASELIQEARLKYALAERKDESPVTPYEACCARQTADRLLMQAREFLEAFEEG